MTAGGCLALPSDWPVALSGRLSSQVFPGPPEYESVGKGDEAETAFILTLDAAICIDDGGEYADAAVHFTDVHLGAADEGVQARLTAAIGKTIRASGQGFPAHTGHHHAPLVILVDHMDVR